MRKEDIKIYVRHFVKRSKDILHLSDNERISIVVMAIVTTSVFLLLKFL